MTEYGIVVFGLLIVPTVYLILPRLVCRLNQQMHEGCLPKSGFHSSRWRSDSASGWLPAKWREKLVLRLQRAGYFQKRAIAIYLALMILPLPLLGLMGMISGNRGIQPLMIGVLAATLTNTWISGRIKKRQKAYTLALYKIYRFLDLQLNAGIKITDSLKGLPEAVQDSIVQPILLRFAARYELTLDLEQAFSEIRLAFPGADTDLLSTHLRQCLQTGEAGRSLLRMEDLLFSRTFSLMQADTRKIRFNLMIAAFSGIMPGIILFLYPLIDQALKAVQVVFG